jgi:hypothetical protein
VTTCRGLPTIFRFANGYCVKRCSQTKVEARDTAGLDPKAVSNIRPKNRGPRDRNLLRETNPWQPLEATWPRAAS